MSIWLLSTGGLSLLFSLACAWVQGRGEGAPLRLVFKTLASIFFCLTALLASTSAEAQSTYAALVLAALFLGALGDVFLALGAFSRPEHGALMEGVGGVSFFLGHLLFLLLFFLLGGEPGRFWPVIFIPPALLLLFSRMGLMDLGRRLLPVALYFGALGVMAASALSLIGLRADALGALLLLSTTLFFASDMVLMRARFGPASKEARSRGVSRRHAFLILPAYYLAQILFALSISPEAVRALARVGGLG